MAASIEAQMSPSLDEILSQYGLKKQDLDKTCLQAIRYEIAIKITNWKMIGHSLDISCQTLHDIQVENETEEERRVVLLNTWHKQQGRKATYYRLLCALYHRRRRDLVESLCGLIKSYITALTTPIASDEQQQPGKSVKDQLKNLESQFNQCLCQLQTELVEKSTSVDIILNSLTLQMPSNLKMEYVSLIHGMLEKLREATTIQQVFHLLGPLLYFTDYQLLKHLIDMFGSDNLKDDISSYETDVKAFMRQTTIGDVICHWPGKKLRSEDFKELWMKISDNPRTYTLEKLNELRCKHCANLQLSAILSAIVNLTPAGSFFAVWAVPTPAVDEMMTAIRQVDPTFYEEEHVLMVILDEKLVYVSDSTKKVIKSTEDTASYVASGLSSRLLSSTSLEEEGGSGGVELVSGVNKQQK